MTAIAPNLGKVFCGTAIPATGEDIENLFKGDLIKGREDQFCYKFKCVRNGVFIGEWEGKEFLIPRESLMICHELHEPVIVQKVEYVNFNLLTPGSGFWRQKDSLIPINSYVKGTNRDWHNSCIRCDLLPVEEQIILSKHCEKKLAEELADFQEKLKTAKGYWVKSCTEQINYWNKLLEFESEYQRVVLANLDSGKRVRVAQGKHKGKMGVIQSAHSGTMYEPKSPRLQYWVKVGGVDELLRLERGEFDLLKEFDRKLENPKPKREKRERSAWKIGDTVAPSWSAGRNRRGQIIEILNRSQFRIAWDNGTEGKVRGDQLALIEEDTGDTTDSWNPAHFGDTARLSEPDGQLTIFWDSSEEPPDPDDFGTVQEFENAWREWEQGQQISEPTPSPWSEQIPQGYEFCYKQLVQRGFDHKYAVAVVRKLSGVKP
ncbi:hypothetical protein [Iningainema tapete]|uniref:Uncharacterized protein n=1 Tax=Iningainema tapete BLCC-T55 TaxID=2748662 RepID=A0A8J6XEU7_9CYAN|nr:hypothetical protein [Iningainema tapete]MBD2771191.1 hypothetical protein [Iningainema tapete BLCC-T55]